MTVTRFDYAPIRSVQFGLDALAGIDEILAELDIERALLITTGSLTDTEALSKLVERAGSRVAATFSDSVQHLPASMTDVLLALASDVRPDGVITLGGGTVTDAGKAVAAGLATRSKSVSDLYEYRVRFTYPDTVEIKPMEGAFIPQVAIPTTLSAAEYDGVFGMTSEGTKDLFLELGLTPDVVVLDPEATRTTPRWLWASTGVRSLDHAVETFLSRTPTSVTDACAVEAIRLLYARLPKSLDGDDMQARLDCLVAGWLSMIGVHNVLLGLSHGIGHQLGGRCGVPHGQTSCIMLPVVLERLEGTIPARMAELARRLGLVADSETDEAKGAAALTGSVKSFISSLGVPTKLSEVGVSRDDFEYLARDAMSDLVVAFSPVDVEEKDVVALLERAY